jgi:glycosyltransferase involved in cell wall biosynthesis
MGNIPYISLCMICGDVHRECMERLLKSVLCRSDGLPLVDEIVIAWNGTGVPSWLGLQKVADPDPLQDGEIRRAPCSRCSGNGYLPRRRCTACKDQLSSSSCALCAGSGLLPKERCPDCKDGVVERRVQKARPLKLIAELDDPIPIRVYQQVWTGHFAEMRQQSYEAANGVWRMYLDGDDVVAAPDDLAVARSGEAFGLDASTVPVLQLRDQLRHLPPKVNHAVVPYDYVIDEDGTTLVRLWRKRIVRWADGWRWGQPVHEDIFPTGGNRATPDQACIIPGLVIRHYPVQPAQERMIRNYFGLKAALDELGGIDRCDDAALLYGVGCVYSDMGDAESAVTYLSKALTLTDDPDNLVVYALLLAKNYLRLGKFREAGGAVFAALSIYPDRPEPYYVMQEVAFAAGQYDQSLSWFRKGQACRPLAVASLDVPPEREFWPKVVAADAYLRLGNPEKSLRLAQEARRLGTDPRLEGVIEEGTARMGRKRLEEAFTIVYDHLKATDPTKARKLAECVPTSIWHKEWARLAQEPTPAAPKSNSGDPIDPAVLPLMVEGDEAVRTVSVLRKGPQASTSPEELYYAIKDAVAVHEVTDTDPVRVAYGGAPRRRHHIVIACPCFASWWGPDSPEKEGTGGSEEAVVYLSRALAEKGCEVEVYAPLPPDDSGFRVTRGVVWRHLREFDHRDPCDCLIWHREVLGPSIAGSGARLAVVWHHDHAYMGGMWTAQVASKGGHLWVSEWQREVLTAAVGGAELDGVVIGNGIPPEQYADLSGIERDPYRAVYASLPYRGLDRLLDIWPTIKLKVPRATLHVYYGFATVMQIFDDPAMRATMEGIAARLEGMRGLGVVNHGRLGQAELVKEFARSGVWLYPTAFAEVSCIVGMRVAAAGVIPVFGATAALPETQPDKTYMVEGCDTDDGWQGGGREAFIGAAVKALQDDGFDREGLAARTLATKAWGGVAGKLLNYLDKRLG